MADKVLVPGIPLAGRLGATREERRKPQKIVVDIELACDVSEAAREDSLDAAIDYVAVRDEAARVVSERPHSLVETVAARIAESLVERFPASEAKVRVRKPSALAEFGVPWAGVEVVRRRRG